MLAPSPGSKFNRQGGSNLDRRQQVGRARAERDQAKNEASATIHDATQQALNIIDQATRQEKDHIKRAEAELAELERRIKDAQVRLQTRNEDLQSIQEQIIDAEQTLQAARAAEDEARKNLEMTVEIICDDQCVANAVQSRSAAPTGADILQASGRPATPEQLVLQILRRGGLESIRLEEHADLSLGNKFVISAGDRTYRFTVDDKQYEWPHRLISGLLLHELSGARPDQRVAYQQAGALEVVEPNQLVDLHSAGVEKFVLQTKPEHWKLKVQGTGGGPGCSSC